MRYESAVRDYPAIVTDYPLPVGGDEGPTSLELLLVSLATCVGGAVSHVLRKAGLSFEALSVRAAGVRRSEHPTYFKALTLEIDVAAENLTEGQMVWAVKLAEREISPVWNLVKKTVPVTYSCVLNGKRATMAEWGDQE